MEVKEKLNLCITCDYKDLGNKLEQVQQFLKTAHPLTEDEIFLQIRLSEKEKEKKEEKPSETLLLTISEASRQYHIGETRLRSLLNDHRDLCFSNGNKMLVKKEAMDHFIRKTSAI